MNSYIDSFIARLQPSENGCLEWSGVRLDSGHGQFTIKKKRYVSSRFAYELFVGPIPEGHHIHHECGNPPCCNPEHLTALKPADHMRQTVNACSRYREATHCSKGHEFTPENTQVYYWKGARHRACRACNKVWQKQYHQRKLQERINEPGVRFGNYCQRGHEYTPENTMKRSDGGRKCRQCHNARSRERKRRYRSKH